MSARFALMLLRLDHLRLDLTDLTRVVPFYTDVLGLTVWERATDDESHYVFLTDGAATLEAPEGMLHHRLLLRQSPESPAEPGDAVRSDHFTFEVGSPAEWLHVVEKLRAAGADVDLREAGIAWPCYTRDPESVRVETYCDRRQAEGGQPLWHGRQETLPESQLRDVAQG